MRIIPFVIPHIPSKARIPLVAIHPSTLPPPNLPRVLLPPLPLTLLPPLLLLLFPQRLHPFPTRPPSPNPLIEYPRLLAPRVFSLPHFPLAMVVCARDVEAVDVGWS